MSSLESYIHHLVCIRYGNIIVFNLLLGTITTLFTIEELTEQIRVNRFYHLDDR